MLTQPEHLLMFGLLYGAMFIFVGIVLMRVSNPRNRRIF
jgi:hypothetical protein